MEELVYISINNWAEDDTYPDIEPISTWMDDNNLTDYLMSLDWVKEQGISVLISIVDMSFNFNIIAPKSWVNRVIPDIYNYPKFIMQKDEDGKYYGRYSDMYPSIFEAGCTYYYELGDQVIQKVIGLDKDGHWKYEEFEKID